MAMILKGMIRGMRPVGGVVEEGSREGEVWHFLSLEITDPRFGNVYSCQLRSNDKQYKALVEVKTVTEKDEKSGKSVEKQKHVLKDGCDWTGHNVVATIAGITAGERDIVDKDTGAKRRIIQVRTQVTNLKDMGEPNDEE